MSNEEKRKHIIRQGSFPEVCRVLGFDYSMVDLGGRLCDRQRELGEATFPGYLEGYCEVQGLSVATARACMNEYQKCMAKYREELDKMSNERKSPRGGIALTEEDYAKYVRNLKERTEAMMKLESGAKLARLGLISERTLWINQNSTSLVHAQPDMRRDMVRAHRQVELELFGSVTDLPGEQELLEESSVKGAAPVIQSGSQHVRRVEVSGEHNFAVYARRAVLFLLAMSIAYFFIWVPWGGIRANFLVFSGFGLIQIAAVYTQDLRDDPMSVLTAAPLFLNPFIALFISGLGLVGLLVELIIGFRSKPWWEALLLPIPPLIVATYLLRRPNPVAPFFVGIAALFLGLALKLL